jgi:NADPH:quinone reductase-like Zn-dependent oxidoreductase
MPAACRGRWGTERGEVNQNGAGEVAAIGDGVTRVKLGERVIGTFHPRWFGGPLSADLPDRPARRQPGRDTGRTFPFAEAKAAYRHFEGRGHFGKVVITHG